MGLDKAWLEVGGETALERISGSLRGVGLPVVVVARPGQDLPVAADSRAPPLSVWRDPTPAIDGGPLVALDAVLGGAAADFRFVFVTATDAVALDPADALDLLHRCEAGDRDGAVVVDASGRAQPLLAAYRVAAARRACRAALSRNERSLRAWLAELRVERVAAERLRAPLAAQPCNTPAQWRALCERLEAASI